MNSDKSMENKTGIGSSPYYILIVLALGVFMTAIDAFIFIPALPTIVTDLNTSYSTAAWVLTIFMLFFTALLPLSGKLSDAFGRKKLFITGIAVFVIGSLAASISWNIYSLIAFMGIQGIGAGLVLPTALAAINEAAPKGQSGKMMGLLVALSSVALIIGPNLGGYLIQNFGWKTIFYINIPIGILAIIMALKFKESYGETTHHIDIIGSALLVGSIAMILISFVRLESLPFTDITVFPLFIASIIMFITLILYERHTPEPILNIPLLKKGKVLSLNLANLFSNLALFTAFVYVPMYAQLVLKLNVQDSGVLLTPLSISMLIMALIGGVLLDKFGAKRVLLLGSPILSLGLFILTYYVTGSTGLAITLAIIGLGMGLTLSAYQLLMLSYMPKGEEATGAGILNTFKGVGNTLGPVIGAFFLVNVTKATLSQAFSNIFLFGTVASIIAVALLIFLAINDRPSNKPVSDI